jgi:hypothetical protein
VGGFAFQKELHMPGRGPQTFKKRQKEQQRKEKQEEKMARRLARKNEPAAVDEDTEQSSETDSAEGATGVDSDHRTLPEALPPRPASI